MSEEKNLLDDIFNTTDDEVETFMDAIAPLVKDAQKDDLGKIAKGEPEQISAPESLIDQVTKFISIQHGWHDKAYVWHFAPSHPKKPFKYPLDRVVYGIAKAMNDVIPSNVEVKIWLPYADWDIQEITFKAMDLKDEWSVTDAIISKLTEGLFEILNQMV